MLSLKFTLTKSEYFDYNYHTAWAASDRKKYRWRYYLRVMALYAVIASLYIQSNPHHNLVFDFSVFAVIAIVYFAFIPYFIRFSIRRRVNEMLSEPQNKHILEPAEVIILKTGIIDKDELSESKYEWEAIVKKDETNTSYYLYTNSYHAIVIPKRTLKDPAEKRQLEQLFDSHLPLSSEFK